MIYEASLSGILRIIFWILVISFVIRLVARMALPHVIRKAEEKMRERSREYGRSQQPPRSEGEITIEKGKNARAGSGGGDYVDYVEIKD